MADTRCHTLHHPWRSDLVKLWEYLHFRSISISFLEVLRYLQKQRTFVECMLNVMFQVVVAVSAGAAPVARPVPHLAGYAP